jgi:transcriptional/translational regulatory protein YebC/TACO1
MAVKDALTGGGLEPAAAEVGMIPQTYSELDMEMGEKVLRLVDALEDLDDVTNVYTNANFPDELMT